MTKRKTEKPAEPPREPPSKVPAAESLFKKYGIAFKKGADPTYPWTVGGYMFWPLKGFWRSADSRRQGYSPDALIRTIEDDTAGLTPPPPALTLKERRASAERAVIAGLAAVADALDPKEAPPPIDAPFADCQGEAVQ